MKKIEFGFGVKKVAENSTFSVEELPNVFAYMMESDGEAKFTRSDDEIEKFVVDAKLCGTHSFKAINTTSAKATSSFAIGDDFVTPGASSRNGEAVLYPPASPNKVLMMCMTPIKIEGVDQYGSIIDHMLHPNGYAFSSAIIESFRRHTPYYDGLVEALAHIKATANRYDVEKISDGPGKGISFPIIFAPTEDGFTQITPISSLASYTNAMRLSKGTTMSKLPLSIRMQNIAFWETGADLKLTARFPVMKSSAELNRRFSIQDGKLPWFFPRDKDRFETGIKRAVEYFAAHEKKRPNALNYCQTSIISLVEQIEDWYEDVVEEETKYNVEKQRLEKEAKAKQDQASDTDVVIEEKSVEPVKSLLPERISVAQIKDIIHRHAKYVKKDGDENGYQKDVEVILNSEAFRKAIAR